METNIYDLIIVGGGPAGASAAIYAARKRLKSVLILKEWGGQSNVSLDIENWIGTPHITGDELAKKLKEHVEVYAKDVLDVKVGHLATETKKVTVDNTEYLQIYLDNGEALTARAILVASGSNRRKLAISGAEEFENKGITYCASCDGPIFAGMDVVVIGGGNAGFDSAAQLLAYTNSVTLLSRSEPKADPITIQKLERDPKFKLIKNVTLKNVEGDKFVSALTYTDKVTGEDHKLEASGIFVEIGQIPSTSWIQDLVDLDEEKRIKIDPWTKRASSKNLIWAAGDCTNILYQQNNIAAGEAISALENIYHTLKAK